MSTGGGGGGGGGAAHARGGFVARAHEAHRQDRTKGRFEEECDKKESADGAHNGIKRATSEDVVVIGLLGLD